MAAAWLAATTFLAGGATAQTVSAEFARAMVVPADRGSDASSSVVGELAESTGGITLCGLAFVGLVIRRRRQLSGGTSSQRRTASRSPASA